jgi:RNA polymerase sigma-70 factor (ECF subfamily)
LDSAPIQDLLHRISAGDRLAFHHLVQQETPRLLRMSLRLLMSSSEAEDVVQDVMLRVWTKAAGRPDADGSASGWLSRITVNACLDRLRKKPHFQLSADHDVLDPRMDSEAALLNRERQQRITAAIDNLPDRQRIAVVLSYHEGLSNEEAAQALDVSISALEALLVRARRKLREILNAAEAAGGRA